MTFEQLALTGVLLGSLITMAIVAPSSSDDEGRSSEQTYSSSRSGGGGGAGGDGGALRGGSAKCAKSAAVAAKYGMPECGKGQKVSSFGRLAAAMEAAE